MVTKNLRGLELFPGDSGGSSGVGGWSIGCDENFLSLIFTGISLSRFVGNRLR